MPKADPNVHNFSELDALESHQLDLKTIPPKFDGMIIASEIKPDTRNNKCLYITIAKDGDEEQLIRQKFTATTVGEFRDSLAELGFKEIPVPSEMLEWEKTKLGRAIYDRWIPIKISTKKPVEVSA